MDSGKAEEGGAGAAYLHAHRDGGVRGELVGGQRVAGAQHARRDRAAAAQLVAQRAREEVDQLEGGQDPHDAHAARGAARVMHEAVPRRDAAREAGREERGGRCLVVAAVVAREGAGAAPLSRRWARRGREQTMARLR